MQPPQHVLAAFGVSGSPERLAGGTGTSWRCGSAVLKPLESSSSLAEAVWQADVLGQIDERGFRVPRPLCAADGSPVVDGWSAWTYVEGEHREQRWTEIIAAGEQFHAALAQVPRPSFLVRRTDHWAIGDRVAWEELPAETFAHVKHVPRLVEALRPVIEPAQIVHGDLTGNVLFAEGLAPAVIDFAPYWRPVAFATAVVVGDALAWEGADDRILEGVRHVADFEQYLLRALIYRIVVDALFRPRDAHRPDEKDAFAPVVELACFLAG